MPDAKSGLRVRCGNEDLGSAGLFLSVFLEQNIVSAHAGVGAVSCAESVASRRHSNGSGPVSI